MLAAHGLNVTRSFCFWPDFVPEPERLDGDVLDRFADFLDAHVERGLGTIPTFVVGHMSGQNWDPAWRDGRDLYRDAWLVSQQAWLAGELARRFGRHRAVVGWLVSNEMPLYGGPAAAEEIEAWARPIVQAVRAAGATQPISLGDGAWGVEVTGRDNGYSLRTLAPLVDFVGPHTYPMQDDELRQLLTPAFTCELAGSFGKPVILEEFGVSSDFAADDHAADYYRRVLHTTLLAGARGWLAWCNADFDDLRHEDPYRHHLFELHFGLTDAQGRPKPALLELERFAALVRDLAARGFERVAGEAAIVVPEHFERVLPFTEQSYSRRPARQPPAGVRRGTRGRPAGRARPRARRDLRRRPAVPPPEREGPHRARRRSAAPARVRGRDRLRLVLRRQHREPARPVARVVGGALRRPAPAPLRPRRPHRGRRDRARARGAARRPAGRRDALVPGDGRNGERPRLPAGRAGRRAGRRRGRPRPAGAPAPRARQRPHRLLHLPARAPRRAHAAREPGEHVAPVLGARGRGGRVAAGPRRRSPRARRARPEPRLPDRGARERFPRLRRRRAAARGRRASSWRHRER